MSIADYLHPDIHLLRSAIITSITTSVWVGLFLSRQRNPELIPVSWPTGRVAPFVEIVVPARNEEDNIDPLLETLVTQNYPAGRFRITVVDDGSVDLTAAKVVQFAGKYPFVRLIEASDLPDGWTGKNNAMHTGYVASDVQADYLLFVDADTRHHPLMLSTAVQRARETSSALLSLVIHVKMESFWERVIVPQVGELYTLLVGTMDSVNTKESASGAAANGQFMLMTRQSYALALSDPRVCGDVAEDRAIAAALKKQGLVVRLEHGERLVSARVYSSFQEMWAGYSKTMFWASGHNAMRALAVACGLSLYAFLPIASLANAILRRDGKARRSAIRHAPIQLLPMILLRTSVMRRLGVPAPYALLYPVAVGVGNAILLHSLYRVVSGKGVTWKGRTYK